MRILFAALLLASSTAFATCPTVPPPPATPTWLYYDAEDRAAWDDAAIAIVTGTAPGQLTAINIGYVLVQQRRILFLPSPALGSPVSLTPWTDDDRAFFTAASSAALAGAGAKSTYDAGNYAPAVSKAQAHARIVMDFRKTRLCSGLALPQ